VKPLAKELAAPIPPPGTVDSANIAAENGGELKLVHVVWECGDNDEGLVSLTLNKVLAYAYGKRLIFDAMDAPLVAHICDEEVGLEFNWGDVPKYLQEHPEKIVPFRKGCS
jgi:hypothetical protein